MTGKELIIYILENNLENEVIFKNAECVCLMTENEAAAKFEVGVQTIRVWYAFGLIQGIKLGDDIYYLRHQANPKTNIERRNNELNGK